MLATLCAATLAPAKSEHYATRYGTVNFIVPAQRLFVSG